jgi:hypothetical protein
MVSGHSKDFCSLDLWVGIPGISKTRVINRYKKLQKLYTINNFDDCDELQQKVLCRAEEVEKAKNNLCEKLFHDKTFIPISDEEYDLIHLNGDFWDKSNLAKWKFVDAKKLIWQKNFSGAIVALKETLILNSTIKGAYLILFVLYLFSGKPHKALKWLWLLII